MTTNLQRLLLALVFLPVVSDAKELPLWEAGAGLGVLSLPDYRGSDEQRSYVLPIPYLVYRGEKIKVDRQVVRGLLYKSERTELDFDFNGSPPVKSAKNQARAGMPNLDPTLEAGPSLKIKLIDNSDSGLKLHLLMPLRTVYATDFSRTRHVGYVFSPKLNWNFSKAGPQHKWNFGLSAGPVFADSKNYNYYYAVDNAYSTPARPSYTPRGGYGGFQLTMAANRRFENMWFGAFVRVDDMHGAVFADSPLVKTQRNVLAGVGVSWIFAKSSRLVQAEEE